MIRRVNLRICGFAWARPGKIFLDAPITGISSFLTASRIEAIFFPFFSPSVHPLSTGYAQKKFLEG
jgi:hypothetical protein